MTYKGRTFEWARGRLLTNATRADGAEVSMTYYANGLRASKEIGDASYKYFYSTNGNLLQITTQLESGEDSDLVFVYDSTGVAGFTYNGNFYHYVRNTFGDVTDIYQSNYWVAHYTYDAWGNHTVYDPRNDSYPTHSSFIGNLNPIRYRGYFYDTDLGLYYLNSRYYDSNTGRFINADTLDYLEPKSINGLNLYAYCYNNPINYADPTGHMPFFIVTAIIGAIIGVAITAAVDYIPDKEFNLHWGWYVGAGVIGALVGAGIGMGISYYATGTLTANFKGIRWGYAIKSAAKGNYDKVLKLATQNPNSSAVSLGRYIDANSPNNYINIAKANGYTYFDMGKYYAIAEQHGIAWNINEMFLKTQFELGKSFICTSADIAGSYALEIETYKLFINDKT